MSSPAANRESQYIHGTAPDEQARLTRLNDLLNDRCLGEMALTGGEHVLDVGCGIGQLSRAIARRVGPTGRVIGIERSPEQLAEAERLANLAGERTLVEFRQGDAIQLSLNDAEWGQFDVAHARFVLEHVPEPAAVVRSMVRAVRPGGRIILEDDPHDVLRFWPESPGISHLWQAYMRTYDRLGNDPFIGHRLVALLAEAGAAPSRNTWLFFGACAGQPDLLHAYIDNFIVIMQGARKRILNLGEIDDRYFEGCLDSLRRWVERPDAALWYAIAWAEGRRDNVTPGLDAAPHEG